MTAYRVELFNAPGLSAQDRRMLEDRFRVAIENRLGGPQAVLDLVRRYWDAIQAEFTGAQSSSETAIVLNEAEEAVAASVWAGFERPAAAAFDFSLEESCEGATLGNELTDRPTPSGSMNRA